MGERIDYDEFGLFHENAAEYGLPYDGPPMVERVAVDVGGGRRLSALRWKTADPELVLLHGGAQNAHTWDTVALALDRPLLAVDLPGHGHSDGPGPLAEGQLSAEANAVDVATAVRRLAPGAAAVVGMSLGGLTTIALARHAPELVRKVVLVDVLPGIKGERAKHIVDFVNGPPSFANLQELLDLTVQFNPTRSLTSLRRGILHNAEQQEDGTWVWRWARHRFPRPHRHSRGVRRGVGRTGPGAHPGHAGAVRRALGRGGRHRGAAAAGPGHADRLGPRRRGRGRAPPPPPLGPCRPLRRGRPQYPGRHAPRARRPHRGFRLREVTTYVIPAVVRSKAEAAASPGCGARRSTRVTPQGEDGTDFQPVGAAAFTEYMSGSWVVPAGSTNVPSSRRSRKGHRGKRV